jgi:hypothetical protein
MTEINLRITLDDANLILEALGQQPFAKVFTLISKLQQQASEQLRGGESVGGPIAPGVGYPVVGDVADGD